jgi:hypothetical protein
MDIKKVGKDAVMGATKGLTKGVTKVGKGAVKGKFAPNVMGHTSVQWYSPLSIVS